jgi:hypothetical protein
MPAPKLVIKQIVLLMVGNLSLYASCGAVENVIPIDGWLGVVLLALPGNFSFFAGILAVLLS